jgi:hypothetical protein
MERIPGNMVKLKEKTNKNKNVWKKTGCWYENLRKQESQENLVIIA